MNTPSFMTSIEALQQLQVIAPAEPKKDSAGSQKVRPDLGAAWRVPCEIIAGQRSKTLPNGQVAEVLETKPLTLTVWGAEPSLQVGEYYYPEDLMIGSVDGSLFFWSTGLTAYDPASAALDELGGK